MNFVNYIIIAIFTLFLLSSKTRATALVLLFVYFIYYNYALQFHGLNRYMAIGTLEVVTGCYLFIFSKRLFFKHQDISIAETCFILVFVNVFGGFLYQYYYPPNYYDNMCITIMSIQITILLWRVIKDGILISRCSLLHPLFCSIINNINQRHSFMQSRKKESQKAK